MKLSKLLVVNAITTFLLVDILSFLFLKEKVQLLYWEYWNKPSSFGRGYPRYHFAKHASRGFDISKNSERFIAHKPSEIKPYPVWGNSIGCFDHEIDPGSKYEIYLAGDSVTWGYAPLEKKFGSILEKSLGVNVAACGVTHTGQIHQHEKFIDVSNLLGYFPQTVIVSVVSNDIRNDNAHPQATIIDGYQIDIKGKTENQLRANLEEQIRKSSSSRLGKFDPRRYSATFVLGWHGFVSYLPSAQRYVCNKLTIASCSTSSTKESYTYPIESASAAKNRNAIKSWINHSKKQGYRLIFADFNTQLAGNEYLLARSVGKQEFCDFIDTLQGECHSFVEYLYSNNVLDWRDVRWKRDGHLNFKGNKIYADFLESIYAKSPYS